MDAKNLSIFNNKYFRINKLMLVVAGLWTYAPSIVNTSKRIFMAIFSGVLSAPNATYSQQESVLLKSLELSGRLGFRPKQRFSYVFLGRGRMDAKTLSIFNNEYFRMNKRLLLLSGLWPYAHSIVNTSKRIFMAIFMGMMAAPNINGVRVFCEKNFALCGENIVAILYIVSICAKYFSTALCEKKIKIAYELLAEKWTSINDPSERSILKLYARHSQSVIKIYCGYIFAAAIAFSQSTKINSLLDVVHPLNESRPKLLPINGEFIFDPYEHHTEVYLIYCVATVVSGLALLSVDAMYFTVVHQSLATFNIVRYQLTKASNCYNNDNNLGYREIISAIRMHKDALEFINVINSSYGPTLLLIVSLTAFFLSLGVVVILENQDKPIEFMKFAMFEMGVVFHFFYISWPGQKVLNESNELFNHIYKCRWYDMDKKGKALIKIMKLRCSRDVELTACGMYTMNFENFTTVMKTTGSYTTMAVSFRG